ncbi:MAG: YdiU family protein [Alkalinema sp. RL_2_19]|nr:YdiU family protein [Alkalinema sp. RL_2_19]
MPNPILALNFEPSLERLGDDYFDIVAAAPFPAHILRWRNDDLLSQLGLEPSSVSDADFLEAFGQFQGHEPFLALRYHGYQFGEYNPRIGDGRGFLYGQVRGEDGKLYDLGSKGSGETPYSRGGDGRLTLKGGVREVLAAEMLHRMGVRTSRCLSLVETGEKLFRGDEPSPTRSSVMMRMQESHIRFGTFERLHYLGRYDLIATLLEHVVEVYYPHLMQERDRYALFYAELTQRVAQLCAQWMAAGFCHAVLNTDNMAITGESFDYGPFAFIPSLNPKFTAAYFDYFGRYSYANQPAICRWNLQALQVTLKQIVSPTDLETGLQAYEEHYGQYYRSLMCQKLGFPADLDEPIVRGFLRSTLEFLNQSQVGYHEFFAQLAATFAPSWRDDASQIFPDIEVPNDELRSRLDEWRSEYQRVLQAFPADAYESMQAQLQKSNPPKVIVRSEIEAVWEPIWQADNWEPLNTLLQEIRG